VRDDYLSQLEQILSDATNRLHALADRLDEHTYQEMASVLEDMPARPDDDADDYESMRRDYERMRDAERNKIIDEAVADLSRLTTPRPLSELHEDDGPVLAWRLDEDLEVCEPPYVVSSADLELPWEDDDESRWFWTPIPKVRKPDGAR
jgi:hypothetical protein